MKWPSWAVAMAGLTVLAVPTGASAHPHVWVDYVLTAMFEKGRVVALHEEWVFDEDFTAAVLHDVAGEKQVKTLTPAAVAKLEKDAFSNLEHYDYFTHVFAGDAKVGVKKATGFAARLEGPKLVYDFTVPLAEPVDPKPGPASFGIWDDTYYVDVGPAEGKQPKLEGDGSAACHLAIVEDHQHPIYFGSVFPKTVRVTC